MTWYLSDIWSLAGTQMQYTEILIAVIHAAMMNLSQNYRSQLSHAHTPSLSEAVLTFREGVGRRMHIRLTIIWSKNWTWNAHMLRHKKALSQTEAARVCVWEDYVRQNPEIKPERVFDYFAQIEPAYYSEDGATGIKVSVGDIQGTRTAGTYTKISDQHMTI
jgi:hypothetical protein